MEEPLNRVISIAAEGIRFAWGLEGQLQRLNKSLTMIQAKLQDAATRPVTDSSVKLLQEMIQDVAYDAEDFLDEFGIVHNPDEIREDAAGSGLGWTFLQHENRAQESAGDTAETRELNGVMEMETQTTTHSNLSLENTESSRKTKTAEWTLLITSLLLEATSTIFDQLGYALTGMVMAFVALLLSILDLIHKAREKELHVMGGAYCPVFIAQAMISRIASLLVVLLSTLD